MILLCTLMTTDFIIGSTEALPILCVRCARWEREQLRRNRHHLSSAEIGDDFCTFPCQNEHLSIGEEFLHVSMPKISTSFSDSPLEWRWVHTFRCQIRCTLRNSSCSSSLLSNGVTGDRSTKTNDRLSGCTVLLLIEKMNQINTKDYWK